MPVPNLAHACRRVPGLPSAIPLVATLVGAFAAFALLAPTSADAYLQSLTVSKCLAGKLKSEGKGAVAYAGCYSKAAKSGLMIDPPCLTKASGKITGKFADLDKKYTTGCPAGTADGAARDSDAAAFAGQLNAAVGSAAGSCDAAKQKCIGKYIASITACYSKAAGKLATVDSACTAKSATKLADGVKGCLDKAPARSDCTNAGSQAATLVPLADNFLQSEACDLDPGAVSCASQDFALALGPSSVNTTLGTTTHYTVTVTSMGYAGAVNFSATGIPASWTAQVTPPQATVAANGMGTADLAITVPTDGEVVSATPGVDGAGAVGTRSASATLVVANELIIPFASAGVGTGPHGFPATIDINHGTLVRFKNLDDIPHRVHSDGGTGFPHQLASMATGEEYDVTPTDLTTYQFYCHDHGPGTGTSVLSVH